MMNPRNALVLRRSPPAREATETPYLSFLNLAVLAGCVGAWAVVILAVAALTAWL